MAGHDIVSGLVRPARHSSLFFPARPRLFFYRMGGSGTGSRGSVHYIYILLFYTGIIFGAYLKSRFVRDHPEDRSSETTGAVGGSR